MVNVALFCVIFIKITMNVPTNRVYAELSTNNFPQRVIYCSENCTACNKTYCYECKAGNKGDNCEHSCSNCGPATTCDKVSGYCFESCRDGQSGYFCNETCDSKCISCDRLIKKNCISCAFDRYGISCNDICSKGCLHNSCNDSDGVCSLGCSVGYWGHNCKQECSHCKDKVCDNTNGECLNGCADGYNGLNCSTSASHNNFVGHFALTISNIGLVFGLGLVAIVTIVTVIICVKRRLELGRRIVDEDKYDVIRTASRMKLRFSGTVPDKLHMEV